MGKGLGVRCIRPYVLRKDHRFVGDMIKKMYTLEGRSS